MDERGAPGFSFVFKAALMSPRGWGPPLPFPRIRGLFTSRGLLECTMRDLFRKLPNVELLEETEVTRLLASPRDNRMVSHRVEVRSRAGEGSRRIERNLTDDASGGNARCKLWL